MNCEVEKTVQQERERVFDPAGMARLAKLILLC